MPNSSAINQSTRTPKQNQFRERYGPWAVVTGASDGIGREIAARLAEAGLHLVLVARRQNILEQVAANLSKTNGIQTRVIAVDLAQHAGVEHLMTATTDLDVGLLIAAAGYGTSGELIRASLDDELSMLEVNCHAPLALSHHFGTRFVRRKRGGIVLFSSLVAFQGVPRAANYAATKAYIQTLAEGLYLELKPFGVSVLASAPGPVQSGFDHRANMRMGRAATPKDVAQSTLDALGRQTTVRPGLLAMFLEALLTPLPRWARTRILARIMADATEHHA
jgi:uncharacterized protein